MPARDKTGHDLLLLALMNAALGEQEHHQVGRAKSWP